MIIRSKADLNTLGVFEPNIPKTEKRFYLARTDVQRWIRRQGLKPARVLDIRWAAVDTGNATMFVDKNPVSLAIGPLHEAQIFWQGPDNELHVTRVWSDMPPRVY